MVGTQATLDHCLRTWSTSWIITMLLEFLVDFLMKVTWLEMKPEARNEPSALGVVRQLMHGPLLSMVSSWMPHPKLSCFHSQTWTFLQPGGPLLPGLRWIGYGQMPLLDYHPNMADEVATSQGILPGSFYIFTWLSNKVQTNTWDLWLPDISLPFQSSFGTSPSCSFTPLLSQCSLPLSRGVASVLLQYSHHATHQTGSTQLPARLTNCKAFAGLKSFLQVHICKLEAVLWCARMGNIYSSHCGSHALWQGSDYEASGWHSQQVTNSNTVFSVR